MRAMQINFRFAGFCRDDNVLQIAASFLKFAAIPGVICGHKALSRIKYSGGGISGQGLAIAGLVTGYLGIAWAIIFIPMMMAIAIPNFVKARDTAIKNSCINNLRQID